MFDTVVIDLKISNIRSVISACKTADIKFKIFSNKKDLNNTKSIIVPGVGAFPEAIKFLKRKKLMSKIKNFFSSGKPILGICLGMQVFFSKSNEFKLTRGLNIINVGVKRFDKKKGAMIPNIGWQKITNNKILRSKIFKDINPNNYFYFIHSYCVKEFFSKKKIIIETNKNGKDNFCTFVNYKNLYLMQFHPEKSGQNGKKIFKNFKKIIYNEI